MADGSVAFQYVQSDLAAHQAIASSTGQVSPLFANPDGSDAGPVLTTFNSSLPSYWTLGTYHMTLNDGGFAALSAQAKPVGVSNSEHPEKGGNGQAAHKPPMCHTLHCVLVPTDKNDASDIVLGLQVRAITYKVFSLKNAQLISLPNTGIEIRAFEEYLPGSSGADICDWKTLKCEIPNPQTPAGQYPDDYGAFADNPFAIKQTFFINRGQVPVFWPSQSPSGSTFIWHGALTQNANINAAFPQRAIIQQNNPDTQNGASCPSNLCRANQASGN